MSRDPEPPELAALLDTSERPRLDDWSLRAALTRYAQPEPTRVSALLNCVRRIEFALAEHQATIRKRGPEVWATLEGDGEAGDLAPIVELLRELRRVDHLADRLVAWAVAREGERPDAEVDAVTATLVERLAELGVAEQERPRPPRGARSRG